MKPHTPLPPHSRERRSIKIEDLKERLRAFNEHAVKYLVVGGYAFGVHAEPRATKDLDLFIRSDEENSQAVFRALADYGSPLGGLTPADFRDGTTFQIGQPPRASTPCSVSTASASRTPGKTASRAWLMERSRLP